MATVGIYNFSNGKQFCKNAYEMINNNDRVFVFNDWTFASSPSIKPFDHPVYDVWLKKCYS